MVMSGSWPLLVFDRQGHIMPKDDQHDKDVMRMRGCDRIKRTPTIIIRTAEMIRIARTSRMTG